MLFNNNTGALWLTITNVAALSNSASADIVTNTIGKLFVPKTAETFSYDLDGNLTNDGRWSYTWDAENRITSFTRNTAAPVGSRVKLDCAYDSQVRRTQKIVSSWNGSTYVAQSTNKFVYDGWNLIAILDSNSSLLASFQWGIDASGTIQGAGGVEGLISMTVHQGANAGTYFYCYDGNHNVATLVNATNGAVAAQYEYDAFLGILRATGPLAFVNPFVGSTKFCDWETGFLYYGYRYYDPDTGRWPNRDPVDELGHRVLLNEEKLKKVRPDRGNLYGFVRNNPANRIDADGRYDFLSSIELCNRQVENPSNDFILGCCNIRGHDFYRWPDGNGGFGSVGYQNPIGKNGDKPTPDHPEKARLCSRCYRSSGILKYGSNGSSGKGKSGYSASDAEIIDCLKNRPIKGDYRGLRNNCNDWARGAAKDCGLWCSGNSDLVK